MTQNADSVVFEVRVLPRSSKTAIRGVMEGVLKLAVTAPPVDGAANEEVCAFFSRTFGVPSRSVKILSGDHSKNKRVEVRGAAPHVVAAFVAELCSQQK